MILVPMPTFSGSMTNFCHYRSRPGSHIAYVLVFLKPGVTGSNPHLGRLFRPSNSTIFQAYLVMRCTESITRNTFGKIHIDSLRNTESGDNLISAQFIFILGKMHLSPISLFLNESMWNFSDVFLVMLASDCCCTSKIFGLEGLKKTCHVGFEPVKIASFPVKCWNFPEKYWSRFPKS